MNKKHVIRWILSTAAYYTGVLAIFRRRQEKTRDSRYLVLRFHRVDSQAFSDPFHLSVSPETFESQIEFLKKSYRIVGLTQMLGELDKGASGSGHAGTAVAITFDDGYLDNYEEAFPILQRAGVPATIFLTSNLIGTDERFWWDAMFAFVCGSTVPSTTVRWRLEDGEMMERDIDLSSHAAKLNAVRWLEELLNAVDDAVKQQIIDGLRENCPGQFDETVPGTMNWKQAGELLNAGIEIGAHGLSHRLLPKISLQDAIEEIHESRTRIESELGADIRYFAYPGGQVSAAHKDQVRKAGYAAAVSTEDGAVDADFDPFALKRRAIHEHISVGPDQKFSKAMFATTVEGLFARKGTTDAESKIRIFYLIDGLTFSGTQKHLLELIEGLDRDRYDIEVLAMVQGGPLEKRLRELSVRFTVLAIPDWNSIRGIMGSIKIWRRIRAARPDIVHCYLFTANVFGSIIAKFLSVPVVITSRRDLCDVMTERQIRWVRNTHRYSDKVLVNSKAVMQAVSEVEGLPAHRMQLIHNGVRRFRSSDHAERFLKDLHVGDATCIGTLGNLRSEKDPMTLFRAFQRIAQSHQNVVLLIAGMFRDPDLEQEIYEFISRHALDDRVHFLGSVADVPAFLELLDIFVFPSKSEGFSNAILEAMAAGLPVVASEVGGNSEQVVNGDTGLLFPVGDEKACASAIDELLKHPERARLMGREGQERAVKEYSIARMVSETENVYTDLLNRKTAASQ